MPALEYAGRFGERVSLAAGWRDWLARSLGRADLAAAPVADVAAASLAGTPGAGTRWIATPVELIAGLTRLHLSRRGLMRLSPAEQTEFVGAFQRAFAGSDLELRPLDDGQLLLSTPQIAPLATAEPARCAGGDIQVPQGAAAAPLLRLMAEIEMWLHGEQINEARRARGVPSVTGLWLWGAGGGLVPAPRARHSGTNGAEPAALVTCGSDAWLAGLSRLEGGKALPLAESPDAVLSDPHAERAVFLAEVAGEPSAGDEWSLARAVASLDRRLVARALQALKEGVIGRLTIVANDTRLTLGRHSALKRWRRRRVGLRVFE